MKIINRNKKTIALLDGAKKKFNTFTVTETKCKKCKKKMLKKKDSTGDLCKECLDKEERLRVYRREYYQRPGVKRRMAEHHKKNRKKRREVRLASFKHFIESNYVRQNGIYIIKNMLLNQINENYIGEGKRMTKSDLTSKLIRLRLIDNHSKNVYWGLGEKTNKSEFMRQHKEVTSKQAHNIISCEPTIDRLKELALKDKTIANNFNKIRSCCMEIEKWSYKVYIKKDTKIGLALWYLKIFDTKREICEVVGCTENSLRKYIEKYKDIEGVTSFPG